MTTVQEMQFDILKAIVLNRSMRAGYEDAEIADGIIEEFKKMTGESTFESTIEANDD